MALMRCKVTIPKDTAIPKDAAVNVWHFDGNTANEVGAVATITFLMRAFYEAIDSLLSSAVASPAIGEIYRMDHPIPRQPIGEFPIPLTTGTGSPNLPEEVALALSFEAEPVSGMKQSRRRGRIYLGPLATGIAVNANGEVRIGASHLQTVRDAAATLKTEATGSGDVEWVVYSPTTDTTDSGAVGSFASVARGWVDDAWDTQRRRGVAPLTRVTF